MPHDLPRVLVTGFEPFAGARENPSELVAQALHGRRIAGHELVAATLPTAFGHALSALDDLIARHAPALVLCCGLGPGRESIALERVAINIDDARIPDNLGACPVDTPVVAGAPAAYFSSLPIKAILQALRAAGIPAEVSQTAGTYVCNHVFFGLMHRLAQPALAGVRGGFVHLPPLAADGEPGLPLARMVEALDIALACALTTTQDLRASAGAIA